ncbi:hypothetical protein [Nostoc sp. XA010]
MLNTPSHATSFYEFVPTMAMAAIVAGADYLMIEVRPNGIARSA